MKLYIINESRDPGFHRQLRVNGKAHRALFRSITSPPMEDLTLVLREYNNCSEKEIEERDARGDWDQKLSWNPVF